MTYCHMGLLEQEASSNLIPKQQLCVEMVLATLLTSANQHTLIRKHAYIVHAKYVTAAAARAT